jgi:hypothetical protein
MDYCEYTYEFDMLQKLNELDTENDELREEVSYLEAVVRDLTSSLNLRKAQDIYRSKPLGGI